MRIHRLLVPVLLLLPFLEIYVLIAVGQVIGGIATLLLVLAMAVLGIVTIRLQGLATLFRARGAIARGELPGRALLDGLWFLIAGILLLIPGFITDAIALVLFVPFVRRAMGRLLIGGFIMPSRRGPVSSEDRTRPRTIEGEFTRRED